MFLIRKRRVVQHTGITRFLAHCVFIKKCLSDTKYKQNPKETEETVLNKVL